MATSPELFEVRNAIGVIIENGWTALALNPAIPLVWGNEDFDPDADAVAKASGFMEITIAFAAGFPLEVGSGGTGGGMWGRVGQVFGSAFVPLGIGEQEAWKRAGYLEGILRPSRPLSLVRWSGFDGQPGGASGDFFMVQLAARFEYEYVNA